MILIINLKIAATHELLQRSIVIYLRGVVQP